MAVKMLNRQERRKIVNQVVKLRDQSKVKKQYGVGVVITNLLFTLTLWRWTLVVWDRRLT